jgi:DNA modification methylase
MAKETGRSFIGIDIASDYCKLAERRLMNVIPDMFLTCKEVSK